MDGRLTIPVHLLFFCAVSGLVNFVRQSDAELVQQHDILLGLLGRSWCDVRPLPKNWLDNHIVEKQKKILCSQLQSEFDLQRPCLIKDPRLCKLLPLWQNIFSDLDINPHYIISIRNPFEVAQSLLKRDAFSANRSGLLYTSYLFEAERTTRVKMRTVVRFYSLLQDWHGLMNRIESELDFNFLAVDELNKKAVDMFLAPELKHFNVKALEKESMDYYESEPMQMAQTVYQLLSGVMDVSAYQALDAIQVRLDRYLAGLEPWLSSANKIEQCNSRASIAENPMCKTLSPTLPIPAVAENLEQIVVALKHSLTRRDEIITQQNAILQELEKKQATMQEELIRAEAQLDLLKDVMLSNMPARR